MAHIWILSTTPPDALTPESGYVTISIQTAVAHKWILSTTPPDALTPKSGYMTIPTQTAVPPYGYFLQHNLMH